jgi:hypothetical protein
VIRSTIRAPPIDLTTIIPTTPSGDDLIAGLCRARLTGPGWVNRELKQLRTQLTALAERRAALLSELAEQG